MFSFTELIHTEKAEVSLQSDFTNGEIFNCQWCGAKLQKLLLRDISTGVIKEAL